MPMALLLVAACTGGGPRPAAVAPAAPPAFGAPGADVHAGMGPGEQGWHLRAALNVAALSCGRRNPALVASYNRMLARQRQPLAAAYAAEVARSQRQPGAWQPQLDLHMTRLYNYYAWPPAQAGFCAAAAPVATEAAALDPAGYAAFAGPALERLERPFRGTPPAVIAAAPAPPAPTIAARAPAPTGWRIQIGAYRGQPAAEAAWQQLRRRSPEFAALAPRYEPVPRRAPLVRLQLGLAGGQGEAVRMCALVAAAGYACLPVAG
jgi:hypothetical protein